MTKKVLLLGSNGGIGSSLLQAMSDEYDVTAWTSKDLDLNCPEKIFDCNFADYDILINCAGHNHGSWQGALQNTWQNQLSMIMVNYVANLFLLKHYAKSRTSGLYVWISSTSMDTPTPYQSIYAGTKVGSKFSIDLMSKEANHIKVLEAKIGLVKTNMRYRNFQGTKTWEEIEQTYGNAKHIPVETVAQKILRGINSGKNQLVIV